ncbi:MAG: TnpV protein [Acutalibacteraceae bacterium]|nr:TnpV protein [Acutalibacteraceae bacterium]
MERIIYDEKNGLWYELQGNYYLPYLKPPMEQQVHIGIWGQRHLQYIKRYRKVLYLNLLTSGKLNEYLAEIDRQAEEMFNQLVKQYAKTMSVTEQLKAENQMKWVSLMNNIRACAIEVVNTEIIYS